MKIIEIQSSDIKVGVRHRKRMGDLERLAHSIDADGLYQPIGVTAENELIFGLRRLLACRDVLGLETIHARVLDVPSIARGEWVENLSREALTISERVALADTLRAFTHGGDRRSDQARIDEVEALTVDEAAKQAGLGGKDGYYRFKQVEKTGVPELMEAVDAGTIPVSLASKIAELAPEDQQGVLRSASDESKDLHRTFTKLQNDNTEAIHEPDSEYSTPDWLFKTLNDEFRFTLDAAASSHNAKCERYFTAEDDGLSQSWGEKTVWLNPPFHRKLIGDWVRKAFQESQGGATVVMLIPSMYKGYRWWKDCCVQGEVRFLHQYVRFHRSDDPKKTALKDVSVVIFGPDVAPGTVAPLRPNHDKGQDSDCRGAVVDEREPNDFYPTPEKVTKALLRHERFTRSIREPADGDGAISGVLTLVGYDVDRSDLIDRGWCRVEDFLTSNRRSKNLVTNPPYSKAEEFVRKALASTSGKVAMFLPLTFLESRKRRPLLTESCLKKVYVFADRISIYKSGSTSRGGGRAAYAWFVWEHGYGGPPMLDWIDSEDDGPLLPPLEQEVNEETVTLCNSVSPTDAELVMDLRIYIEEVYDIDGRVAEAPVLKGWAAAENMSIEEARRYFRQLPDEVKQLFDDGGPSTAA